MLVFSNLKGDAKIAFSLLYLKLIFCYPYKLEADPKHALRDILSMFAESTMLCPEPKGI